MSEVLKLDDVDVDGAIQEMAHEATESMDEGDTRRGMIKKAGLGAGALMGGGALMSLVAPEMAMAAGKGRPPASFGKGDIGILNYALTLEYLEAAFYNGATAANKRKRFIKDAKLEAFLKVTTRDENAHVKYLKKALGNKAVKKPKFDFKGTNESLKAFVDTAFALENEGVHAYSGQALNIKDPAIVAAAVSILTVEARHASVIGVIKQASPKTISPDGPFDKPFTANKVLKDVTGLGFIV